MRNLALPKYNLVGETFGYLKVIKKDKPYRTLKGIPMAKWICECKCGNVVSIRQTHLLNKATTSCGCFAKEKAREIHKKINKYEIKEEYVEFYTTNGRAFLVDLQDAEKVKKYYWNIDKAGYVKSPELNIRLHRYILNPPKEMYVDHVSGDRTDNRRSNLRICTPQQNSFNKRHMVKNKTGIIGVHQNSIGKYIAQITYNGKRMHLGTFNNLEEAKQARIKAEKEIYGEYSPNLKQSEVRNNES